MKSRFHDWGKVSCFLLYSIISAIILGERTPELVRVMNRPDKAPKRCFLFGFRFLWLYNLATN